jgi:hypothetical protein
MSETHSTKHRSAVIAVLCAALIAVPGAVHAAESVARVTAVMGSANAGDAALDRSEPLGEDSSIETGEDGNCAMLVDEDALIELCASTLMTITRREDTGSRVVKLDAGSTRIVVEPRDVDERIEVHTPAAIATILGTIVFVEVDPATGRTMITSEDNDVNVRSNDPSISGSTTISGSEQITIMPGQAPEQPIRIGRTALANLGGCLVDFHRVALSMDRGAATQRTQDRLAMVDGQIAELPVVGAEPTRPPVVDVGSEGDLVDPADTIEPVDTASPPSSPPVPDLPLPEPCDGLPGDGCFPFPVALP